MATQSGSTAHHRAPLTTHSNLVDMMSMRIDYALNGWWDDNGDPTLAEYVPGGPGWLLVIVGTYLLFVLKVGPQFMRERKPYDMPFTMKVYNLVNIAANVLLFVIGLLATNFGIKAFTCTKEVPFLYRYTLSFGYLYLKIFDLMDTIFFVLRKKQRQVSTLHVIHHTVMPILTWIAIKFFPHPAPSLVLLLNSLVHCVMYLYYYMAAHPKYRQNLWWKHYITIIQIVQFLILLSQALMLYNAPCVSPVHRIFLNLAIVTVVYFIYAFSSFYVKNYVRGTAAKPVNTGCVPTRLLQEDQKNE